MKEGTSEDRRGRDEPAMMGYVIKRDLATRIRAWLMVRYELQNKAELDKGGAINEGEAQRKVAGLY